ADVTLAPKTLFRYKELLDTRIIPCLGHIKLNKLQPTHLTEFYNNLRESGIRKDGKPGGLSESTILHHHRLLTSILNCAVQWQFILNNPATRVKSPRAEKKEARHYDGEQVEYLFKLLEDEHIKYRLMIHLSIFGGMRMGELSGLEWSDINLDNKVLHIHQASQYLPGQGIFTKAPKNISSDRIISLPNSVVSLLREYKLWQNVERANLGGLWIDSNRIFTTYNGKPMFPDTPSKWFYKFIKRQNQKIMNDLSIPKESKEKYLLKELNFHGLRHTNATLLIGQGVDTTTVSKRLGHARTSTTMDIYSHSLKKTDLEASDKLEALFSKENIYTKKQG
ncbi:MAG: hypothetical protein K0R09_3611, partial [Clostridiales bacterium]|nr:hypothetical protein [Clostridiales bacterium]